MPAFSISDNAIRLEELSTPSLVIELRRVDGAFWRLVAVPRSGVTRWWDYPAGDPVAILCHAYAWHREHRCSVDSEPCGWTGRGTTVQPASSRD